MYSVFYSNEPILKQYNKTAPKTWDEMIDTGKLILTEERNKNNTDLIGFNGLYSDNDQGIFSIYEFIYSFRDSVNEYFPEVGSPTFINALKMMKKVKNEISSDEIFRLDENYSLSKIFDGQSIFLKFWILDGKILDNIPYKMTILPGSKEGISSSIVSGINIGVSNNVNNEKLKAIVTALEFIMSKEIQKEYLSNRQLISGIKSLYYDEEVCNEIDCELFKILQPIKDPFITLKRQNSYSIDFKDCIYNFLYGNDTAEEVSQKIIDLTKIYYIITEGQNYQICKPTNTLCQLIIILKWIYIIFIILILLLLIFIEWNNNSIHYDLLFFTSVLYIDILVIPIFITFNYIHIYNYISYYIIHVCTYFITALSNYMFIYGFRLFLAFGKKQNIRIQYIEKISKGFIVSYTETKKNSTKLQSTVDYKKSNINYIGIQNINQTSSISEENSNGLEKTSISEENSNGLEKTFSPNNRSSIFLKIIDYHYNG
ncbi:hypothetical protein PIROE2DRAFT_16015 [Piromyces sp. E2]|nr:hypothetical protein PIROE2DRAFT_16015 [Piromyces sp. E2]|eukprot:OUM58658.1 hypothetical protein PIROE2DRAFT_16015 [Piromyces sp. E2]